MIMSKFVSVICPVYNEEKYIEKCINSILQQDYPKDNLEVLLVDGISKDKTRDIIQEYANTYPFIKLLDNPKQIVPTAMNIGIRAAKGDVIIRLDAHSIYPNNYFSVLVYQLYNLRATNVGGVWNTIPANDSTVCKSIAYATSSSFGMGNALYRIGGSKEIQQVDTVPYGCYTKEIFYEIGFFDEELVRNQDDEFNGRIIKNGGKIFLIPDLVIDYFGRDSIKKTVKMFYQYGLFKPLVNKKLGRPTTIRQFFPLFFLCGIVFGGVFSLFLQPIRIIYLAVLALYLLIGVTIGIKKSIQYKDFGIVLVLPFVFLCIHLSYGWGYLIGLFKVLFKQKFTVKVNR